MPLPVFVTTKGTTYPMACMQQLFMHEFDLPQAPQARTFAEAALQEPSVEIHGVHGRYAMALFHAAVKKGDLNKIDQDLEEVMSPLTLS